MMKKQTQQGFTLIELVIVIVILGILAAIALPRFVNLQQEARAATIDGTYNSLRSGALMVYAKAAAAGFDGVALACINIRTGIGRTGACGEGDADEISIRYGFPASGPTGIQKLFAEIDGDSRFRVVGAGGTTLAVFTLDRITDCTVTYTPVAAANSSPIFEKNNTCAGSPSS